MPDLVPRLPSSAPSGRSRRDHMRRTPPPTDTFTVVSAGATACQPDQVTVVVDSPSTLTGLTAAVPDSGAVDAYDQPLTLGSTAPDPTDPTQTETTWTASIPAGASGLALGSVLDHAGRHLRRRRHRTAAPRPARFDFLATPALTLTAANANLSYPGYLDHAVGPGHPDEPRRHSRHGLQSPACTVSYPVGRRHHCDRCPINSDGTFSDPDFTPTASESADRRGHRFRRSSKLSLGRRCTLTVTSVTRAFHADVEPGHRDLRQGRHGDWQADLYLRLDPGRRVRRSGSAPTRSCQARSALFDRDDYHTGTFALPLKDRRPGGTLYVQSAAANDLVAMTVPVTFKVVHPDRDQRLQGHTEPVLGAKHVPAASASRPPTRPSEDHAHDRAHGRVRVARR